MEKLCGSKFWDSDLTWFTSDPEFTPCFESTVLIWIPACFLWIFALVDIRYSVKSLSRNVPMSFLNICKTFFTLLLVVIEVLRIANTINKYYNENSVYSVDFLSPLIRIVTYTLYFVLLILSRRYGVQSSGVQFIYWFLASLCEIIIFRSAYKSRFQLTPYLYILNTCNAILILGNFLLNTWSDCKPSEEFSTKPVQRPCPEKNCSFLNRILFFWFDPIVYKGYRNPLEPKDIWDLNPEDTSNFVVPIFDKYLKREITKAEQNGTKLGRYEVLKNSERSKIKGNQISILKVLFYSLGSTYLFGAFLKFIPDLLTLTSPQILSLLIDFANGNGEVWKGYLYAILLFVTPFISTLFMAQFSHRMYLTGLRLRTGLVSIIYRKALRMSNSSKKESTVGEIVNLMSVDVQRLMEVCHFLGVMWSLPIIIGLSIYFLWAILGPSSLAGLGILVILIPINGVISTKIKKLQTEQMLLKDKRVKLINEILNGIKVLKLYSWEPSFEDQIQDIRDKEIKNLIYAGVWNGLLNFCWSFSPSLIAITTFTIYVLTGNNLDAQKAFVSISLFNVVNLPLSFIPTVLVAVIQGLVSIKRIDKFLNSEEINPNNITHDDQEVDPIVIEDGYFSWEGEQTNPTLRNLNIRIKPGQLIGIVGTVGSGKSSILNAMLGELEIVSGRANTKGSIGYVAQNAWIQNASLRDNILFGKRFELDKYDRVISACALKPDLLILPDGDSTEIGEKGINLSGGQKHRVSLARAAYNNADVYLLDDPLSAVDSHVGKHIFEHVIGPKGLLRRKTRVLVTHGVTFLSQMDQIIVMKDGEISEIGTFQELLDKKAAFADFLHQHLTTNVDEDSEGQGKVAAEEFRKLLSETESSGEFTQKYRARHASQMGLLQSQDGKPRGKPGTKTETNKLIEIEKSETKSVSMKVYLDYFKAASMKYSLCTLIFYSMFQGLSVGSNIWLSSWSNEGSIVNGTQTKIPSSIRDMYLGVYGTLGGLQAIAIFVASIGLAFATIKSSQVIHARMLKRILQAPMYFFDSTPIGRIVNRFSKDVDIADNVLPSNIRWWINSFFNVIAILVVISYSTPIFLSVVFPIALCYYLVQKFYVSTSRQLKRLESVTRSPIYSHFGETIQGAATIRAYKMQDRFIKDSEDKVDHNQISYFSSMISNRWLQIRLETIGNSVVFFSSLFIVLGRETLNPGIVGLSISYALQITMSLIILVRWTSDVETNIVSVERIIEYSGVVQEAPRNLDTFKPDKSWPAEGCIKFEKYQTRYREGLDLVLKGVTCEIKPGEKIGVVGRTGAGKSSLTLALFRIIEPSGGAIIIDGKDISKMGLHDVRGRLTIIPQDPVLFSGTLRMNLDPFNLYTDEAIWNALEMSHLKSFASELPAGLLYEIAEGGENLSVGQRQLVCLARALLRKAKILVLDEATAAIDLDTDDLIQNTIRSEFKNSTVITIAHRLNTIMDSSRVMVLDNGEIKEYEKPDILLQKKDSIFYSMAKAAGLLNHQNNSQK